MLPTIINNRYKIVKLLGEGGFGKTFLTEDTHLPSGRRCVIKQLKPVTNNPQIYKMVQDRFGREAAILEDLGNSNNRIPKLYAYFPEQSEFYLVQEYIEGKTLTAKVHSEGPMSESAVREILKNLLYVLNFVHSRQIVHRDIKPDNIILRDADNVPVLIDFGAVRESMGTIVNSQGHPTSSIVIGTPGFMPAEQAAGRPVYSSDLYSLAITMIYLLTGKMPHELQTDSRTGSIIWHQYAMNVSPSLRIVLDKAMAYNPSDRYMTAREMLDALQYSGGHNPTPNYPPASPQPNHQGYSEPPTIINSNGRPPYASPLPVTAPPSPPPQPQNQPWAGSGGYPPQNSYPPQNYPPAAPGTPSGWSGGGGTFNTSIPVPPEIQGWNWGAFMLPGLWCLTNQVWIGLLTWVPYVGSIPMPFILGAKGNTWAWRSRSWRSVQDFKAHQRAWAKAGIIVWSSFAALFVLLAFIGANVPEENDSSDTTQENTSQSSPTPSAQPSAQPTSTPQTATNQFQTVEIANLSAYTYTTGLFSINVPQGWTRKDNSNSGEAVVYWQDKTENALIQVNIFPVQGTQTQQQLIDSLSSFLTRAFGKLKNFSMDQPVPIDGGKIRITWSYTFAAQGVDGKITGNSFIEQKGDKVSIFTDLVPLEQFDTLKPKLEEIFGSYTVNPSAAVR